MSEDKTVADAIAKGIEEATKDMKSTIEALAAELSSVKTNVNVDNNLVDVDERKSADEATLRTVGGVLIKEMSLVNQTKVNEQGFNIVLGQTAHIETVDGKKHKIQRVVVAR